MKKEFLNKVLLVLSVIFLILQIVYSQIKLRTGEYNNLIRYVEYVVIVLIMITSLLFVSKENKKASIKLLMIYLVLIVLFIIFLLKGLV